MVRSSVLASIIKNISILYTKFYLKKNKFNNFITVGILTKNNFKLVDPIMCYYLQLGINIKIFLNTYSKNDEIKLYQKYKNNIIMLENSYKFIEPIVEQSSNYINTVYFCYTSSDEFIDLKALREISKIIKLMKFKEIGVSRFWVGQKHNFKRIRGKEFERDSDLYLGFTNEMSRNRTPGMMDTQFRIFKPKETTFNPQIGGFGFNVSENEKIQIPFKNLNCCFFHLDWLVLTEIERNNKLNFYNELNPGIFEIEKFYFLPEELEDTDLKIVKFNKLDLVSKDLIYKILKNFHSYK